MIAIPALRVEPAALGERLEKSRFATAIFADEEGYRAAKCQIDALRKCAEVEWVPCWIESVRQTLDSVEEWCARSSRLRSQFPPGLHLLAMERWFLAMPDARLQPRRLTIAPAAVGRKPC